MVANARSEPRSGRREISESCQKIGRQFLAGLSQTLDVFVKRYCQGELNHEVDIDHVEPLLNGRFQDQKGTNSSKEISPIELLARLQDWLGKQELLLLIECYNLLESPRRAKSTTGGVFCKSWDQGNSRWIPSEVRLSHEALFLLGETQTVGAETWAKTYLNS